MGRLTSQELIALARNGRITDRRLGEALGYAQPISIRRAIMANLVELFVYGDVLEVPTPATGKRGRPSMAYHLNHAQALLIAGHSPAAHGPEVRYELIAMMYRRRAGLAAGGRTTLAVRDQARWPDPPVAGSKARP